MKYILLTVLLITSFNTYALKCYIPTTEEALKKTTDLFIGKAIEIGPAITFDNSPWGGLVSEFPVKLEVLEVLKGEERKYQEVPFSFTFLSSIPIELEEKYIIFDNSASTAALCKDFTLSTTLDKAGPYLNALDIESEEYNKFLNKTLQE